MRTEGKMKETDLHCPDSQEIYKIFYVSQCPPTPTKTMEQ
jgi:hypothetical protein